MNGSRLFKIVYYMLEKGKTTAPELSDKFEVSIRTIYRDIDVISSAGVPIYATQGKNGGIFIDDDFTMDKSFFTETERAHILNALQGIIATDGKNSDELLTKLGAMFQIKSTSWIEVDFSDWVQNKPKQDIFNLIKNAIFAKKIILIKYFGSNGKITERRVQPLKLIFKSKNWYLYGFCLIQNDYRYFKLTRIKTLEILTETFSPTSIPPNIEKQIHIKKTIDTKLKFDKHVAFRVYDEFTDEVTEDEQGNLYVQVNLPDSDFLYSYIFSFSEHVEIVEPQFLREQIATKLKEMQEKYRT
ncbi:helix-turn-helix transcriptional regulator [Listeria seeligeri]|uniref:helix-turn-helix transcriptional regulator n=1 Tax=Listeria seeligeri TaxID=1640 RepID=UPI0010D9A7CC|nr:YafY family protein [Listeria seeligeri]MBC2225354.1 YafY family transcriptional regulator [Listeria seeligeri]MBF2541762.1 YafY family transcriptional regulator [Listeria seeligeri]